MAAVASRAVRWGVAGGWSERWKQLGRWRGAETVFQSFVRGVDFLDSPFRKFPKFGREAGDFVRVVHLHQTPAGRDIIALIKLIDRDSCLGRSA